MEISYKRLKNSILNFHALTGDAEVLDFVRLEEYTERDINQIVATLKAKLLDDNFTELIAVCFSDILLIIVALAMPIRETCDWNTYLRRAIGFSKLVKYSPEVLRYSESYFADKEAPFQKKSANATLKKIKTEGKSIDSYDIVKCCYELLHSNPAFYKYLWDWSRFVDLYWDITDEIQKLYYNQILAILFNMTPSQLQELNKNVSASSILRFEELRHHRIARIPSHEMINGTDKIIVWNFSNEAVVNIEGVLLPIYNCENALFHAKNQENRDKIIPVNSTKSNLKNIAMGLLSGKAIFLVGQVGCGKSTLVEYLARKIGRIAPSKTEFHTHNKQSQNKSKTEHGFFEDQGVKRINSEADFQDVCGNRISEQKNGFLRIQLGDQTDSKVLLGQYRCTDVPGEFIWLPGVLTQAVMNGYWLLLEDIDFAPQDVCAILSNLLENGYLCIPGFRDCLRVSPGFQLFITMRSRKSVGGTRKSIFSLLEKYFYTVNIASLSRKELCQIVNANYPKLATISNRVVDIYLTFASRAHTSNKNGKDFDVEIDSTDDILPISHANIIPTYATINSGRLVSTRDLMKLCDRSYALYSVTTTECAYFIFQNAVDIFCSYLPDSAVKTALITSIGLRLGIIQSRCEYFSNKYKPDIEDDTSGIKVGRTYLGVKTSITGRKKRPLDSCINDSEVASKKSKVDDKSFNSLILKKTKTTTFSFTRLACCLLERIGICINQVEPVLLVGETGVGKTSCVQYLAAKTNHKLIVVNMNNQSDVSDLIGGFKPVDLSYVISPVRYEFELLFRKTFNENKNEKFLSNVSACYNRADFVVLVKLMLKITETFFQRVQRGDMKITDLENLTQSWKTLHTKLTKLSSQLEKSSSVSFAFIAGALVNCIKEGDWVLLDEINLASDETLECLSTILEPNGSVVLLEKGDLTPVKRHPEFRIFACMNPRTDVGKKDLPTGIRNRFTEFYVDEMSAESDLRILVGDYLKNTGITGAKVTAIVKLYTKLRLLSQLELNDGLGNRPVYSLRTLCRALTICAKNLCGSIDRNIYESFCLSFLTQLDNDCHKVVLELIKTSLLPNWKAIVSQEIPKPGSNYVNFEGYWIEQGTRKVEDCPEYILTETVRRNLKDVARIISIGKLPTLLQGPTSAGKTSLIEYIAKRSGNHCLRINNHEHTDLQEYIGTYVSNSDGKLVFREGILVQAMRNGFWIILDELNLASTDILEALNRVLDDNRELFIPETQVVVKAHPKFMLFATQNPPGLYGGRKTLSRAFKNRFIELHFSEIPKFELEIILEKRCHIPKSYSHKMVKCMSDLQVNRKTTAKVNFTLRDLFRWGNRYTYSDKELLANNSYDWNQHLVDEGYLVLSAKVRTKVEIQTITETLFSHFRKKINVHNLYSLHENTSLVTKKNLESLLCHSDREDIIWTESMTRMAVLCTKALEFNEPVLLVGPTGCGKTTICQIIANIQKSNLRILNCHMHTEGADFLGGLRPCRSQEKIACEKSKLKRQLFEWVDGPLIHAMLEGSFFMVDEISLAEDSVLERLNSVLEPSRTILLAEKGGAFLTTSEEFIVRAAPDFQFLATMNPGGDFGKKELSPALRNRFTEIWCEPSNTENDLVVIASNTLKRGLPKKYSHHSLSIAKIIVEVVSFLKLKVDQFKFSIRDVLAWSNYININANNTLMALGETILYGLNTVFLDSLEMIPYETVHTIESIRKEVIHFAKGRIQQHLETPIELKENLHKSGIENEDGVFGIKPFLIEVNPTRIPERSDFQFDSPTTKKNLLRLLSALSVNKAILLEGPPGVGKTSTVENLAKAIGYNLVRINLCEHTDLADLFGTDLPAEESILNGTANFSDDLKQLGSFEWRDGPLLSALKSKRTWILLDELNLAPQSVLEGLNAILDHRGEVFISELNATFYLGQETRIFACQNPYRLGGGRKGLPQSFLNRFTKVYLSKLNSEDLLHVVHRKYNFMENDIKMFFSEFLKKINFGCGNVNLFEICQATSDFNRNDLANNVDIRFDLLQRMVKFSERLDSGLTRLEFGLKGGPFEINLRDLLRWCEFLFDPNSGFSTSTDHITFENSFQAYKQEFDNFLLILYERMKLVYYQRMRLESDRKFIRNVFGEVFDCDAEHLHALSEDVSLYWTDSELYLNDIVLKRDRNEPNEDSLVAFTRGTKPGAMLLTCQVEFLKNLVECVHLKKPVILSGPTNSGKTKLIDTFCLAANQFYDVEIIDDSVMGSFQQIDLNRHLEEISQSIESIYIDVMRQGFIGISLQKSNADLLRLIEIMKMWDEYSQLSSLNLCTQQTTAMSQEILLFVNRKRKLSILTDKLFQLGLKNGRMEIIRRAKIILDTLENIIMATGTLNTGGHFEWVDSKIVKCLKVGGYICLEHVNLCSPAILDRLNSAFEPNGSLLLSEKGLSIDDASEVVFKHKNFQAFLTMDPKNGELSRAMRNRCIELDLSRIVYTQHDLQQIVFANGVSEMYLIQVLVRIHKLCIDVAESEGFSVSHIVHFAYLVACNKRAGLSDEDAVYNSAMEVYVHSSDVDMLGYGHDFYQSKLRDIISEECTRISPKPNMCDLNKMILKPNEINQMSMIQMQLAPFVGLLKSYPERAAMKETIESVSAICTNIDLENPFESIKFYIFILYAMSTVNDATLRYKYLSVIVNDAVHIGLQTSQRNELNSLNKSFYKTITETGLLFKEYNVNLPWNSKLFPRIKQFKLHNCFRGTELCLNVKLLYKLLISPLNTENTTRLQKMSAISYSQAISMQRASDGFNNVLLQQLWPFLQNLQEFLISSLRDADVSIENYSNLILSLLWFNRMYNCSKANVVSENNLNMALIDKLLLHFKWTNKYLLRKFPKIWPDAKKSEDLLENFSKFENYALTRSHPLNRMQKKLVKRLLGFVPYSTKNQIDVCILSSQIDEMTSVAPMFGKHDENQMQRNFRCASSVESDIIKNLLADSGLSLLDYISEVENCCLDNSANVSKDIKQKVNSYFEKITKNDEYHEITNINEILQLLEKINDIHKSDDEDLSSIGVSLNGCVDLVPLREFFATSALFASILTLNSGILNENYFSNMPTSSCHLRKLIKIVNSRKYQDFKKAWVAVLAYISKISSTELDSLVAYLSPTYYRNFSTFNRIVFKMLQLYYLTSHSNRPNIFPLRRMRRELSTEKSYCGPALTNCLFNILFEENGSLKQIELNDLISWKTNLNEIREIMWNNSSLVSETNPPELSDIVSIVNHARKLLVELEYIETQTGDTRITCEIQYNHNFQCLTTKLKNCLDLFESLCTTDLHLENVIRQRSYFSALLKSLVGSVELCVYVYVPEIDPVEKNRLKTCYENENMILLKRILTTYDIMKAIMRYNGLANEELTRFEVSLAESKARLDRLSIKTAVRPEICKYNELAESINYFQSVNCKPEMLLGLVNNAIECFESISSCIQLKNTDDCKISSFLNQSIEIIKKLELWIVNSGRFIFDLKKKFSVYYYDITEPLECCIIMVQSGFEGFKDLLTQQRSSFVKISNILCNVNHNGSLCNILQDTFEFPSMHDFRNCDKIVWKLEQMQHLIAFSTSDTVHRQNLQFKMLKASLHELKNHISVASNISEESFVQLESIFRAFNTIWKDEDEMKRMKKVVAENLYVNKTFCENKSEEDMELEEIQFYFPTSVQEDFNEFIMEKSLEKSVTMNTCENDKNAKNLLEMQEFKFIGENFVNIIENFSRLYYYTGKNCNRTKELDYICPFQMKLEVFLQLANSFKTTLNSAFDISMFNTYAFVIGLQQDSLRELNITDDACSNYNFYKDSNINEISTCLNLLNQIVNRTNEQLALYPDHAILKDIIHVVGKMQKFSATSPLARFTAGFQILRQKLSQWNDVAHKGNNLRDLEAIVAEFIQKWTKLELQFWRNCLCNCFESVQDEAYKYWFFLYNLLHEYLERKPTHNPDVANISEINNVIRQFIENSNYADFSVRMRLLKTFELYLNYVKVENATRKGDLISLLRNMQIYFNQFTHEIEDTVKSFRIPIEKKLRDYVKIESFTKDLSYFSLKNNINRAHRTLNKFLKEYQSLLRNNISPVFKQKESFSQEYNFENEKRVNLRYDSKHKYYMLDSKNFVAPYKLRDFCKDFVSSANTNPSLVGKSDKLFTTSRIIVREIIENSQYSRLIHCLDSLLIEKIETCEYLRNLEVDRSQDKPKQKAQAKQILSQKKKGLIDLYKTLVRLGVNFKSGLKELSLNSELTDIKIKPYCIKTMLASRGGKLDQNLINLNENLDLYYAKCIFKLKLLQNVMLTPNPELAALNADRLKGFATDMFLLVQNQRTALSELIIELHDVRKKILNITALAECLKEDCDSHRSLHFEQLDFNHRMLKNALCEIRSVLEQYTLLLKCSPSTKSTDNTVLIESSEEFSQQGNKNHSEIIASIHKIVLHAAKLINILQSDTEIEYLNAKRLNDVQEQYWQIIVSIENLRDEINDFRNESLPVTSPLNRLLFKLKAVKFDQANESRDVSSIAHVDIELENVAHILLIAMQTVYKKHSFFEKTMEDNNKKETSNTDAGKYSMLENHLKEKIHKNMIRDIADLRMANLNKKLSDIMLAIKYTGSSEEKIDLTNKMISLLPLLEQYYLLGEFYLFLQLGAHKVSLKMLSVMLTVFVELGMKGFCIPPDVMQDDELGQENKNDNGGSGFGLEDGKGETDVSDKIESEDQLDDAKKPEDRKNDDKESETNCKEENGIEMSEDFDATIQDINKEDDDNSVNDDDDEECDKQMGETDTGAEKLDDQIWGSGDEQEEDEEENELSEDEGVNGKDKEEKHNDTAAEADGQTADDENKESGLDAGKDEPQSNEKHKQDDMKSFKDPEQGDDEQANPYHNQLEEPDEPEEIDIKDCNLDDDDAKEEEGNGPENPFEIDKMKDTMEIDNSTEDKDQNEHNENENIDVGSDSGQESEFERESSDEKDEPDKMSEVDDKGEEEGNRGEENVNEKVTDEDVMNDNEEKSNLNTGEDYSESKDTSSREDNIHSTDEKHDKGSNDQVANESEAQQNSALDTQDTGEETKNIGHAESDVQEGHQGIAENKQTLTNNQASTSEIREKKAGNVDEERLLGDEYDKKVQQLQTVNALDETKADEQKRKDPDKSIEFQHVKAAEETDLTTLDNATEDQSKQFHADDNEKENNMTDLIDITETEDNKIDETEQDTVLEVNAEDVEHNLKTQKDKSKCDNAKEVCEANEHIDAVGKTIDTYIVPREDSTTAHYKNDLLRDVTPMEETVTSESVKMRKLCRDELMLKKQILAPQSEDYEIWQKVSNKMSVNAREFCEQLRLILEPTKCARLKGDYRTGRRINMRKIIPYIASQFRKDKIWLRRTKPSQRDYKITIAIDDSKSMHHNNSKELTLEAISLVSQALTLLESGNLCVASFGEVPQILLHHTDQFDGPKLVRSLQFEQNQTKIAELLDFIRACNSEESTSSESKIFENLLLIISDGRNIFSEGERKVRNSVKLARLQRIFLIYVIIDNPENKHSILDIQVPEFSADTKSIKMKSYLDNFPFPFYVIVRDLGQLPFVLSEAMRQWFELVSSEQ